MLVLSRKVGERVLIGGQVVVTVVRIGPNAIRLGIEAPKSMNIVREELQQLGSVADLNGIEIVGDVTIDLVTAGDLVEA